MRLFIAIEIPPEIRATFAALLKEFRAVAPQVKWVRPENLHVTLKFLGEAETAKLSALQNALSAIRSHQPVNLEFRGLGFFPNEKRPKVFWAGLDSSPNLKSLAADIDSATHRLGFPLEDRPFAPHLTLARFQPPEIPPKLLQANQQKSAQPFGSLQTGEIQLIESKLKPAGAEYTTVQTFRFAPEA
ncbi:MAG TPA: RNA 2',3'-cyclic phosphodiesterase [Candidatus Acidoferrum sp.]|nr:RNA 2',3'-cyclic phosphodiesterase [Candidatus Acidoferrum sp.]